MKKREKINLQIDYVLKCKHEGNRRQIAWALVIQTLFKNQEDQLWLFHEMYQHLQETGGHPRYLVFKSFLN